MHIHWRAIGGSVGKCYVSNYPGGEPLIKDFALGVTIDRMLIRPTSMVEFMGGLFFADALADRGYPPMELVLPFVPGARQDRLNPTGDMLFTAKSVAKEINARGFKKVIIFDPHSDVTPALVDRCQVVHADECFAHIAPDSYEAVVAPDAGAEKRAGRVAKRLGVPLIHAWKTRDLASGKIAGFGCEPTHSIKRVLVVDDICDGGGTFLGLADVLKLRGIRPDLYVTHGIFSQGTKDLAKHFSAILCTDSIAHATLEYNSSAGFRVIPVCKHYMEGIT